MIRTWRCELTRLLTLRSMKWSLLATVGVALGFSILVALSFRQADMQRGFDPIFASFYSLTLAQLAVITYGVMSSGHEHTHHTIRTSLLAVPRRGQFYLGKILAVATSAGAAALVAVVACHWLAQWILGERGVGFFALDGPRALVGGWLYLTGISLFAMGVASLLRSTSGALAGMLPLFLLGSQGLGNLEGIRKVAQFLPDYAGTMIFHTAGSPDDPFFPRAYGPWLGMAIFGLWVTAALIVGYLRTRRDV